MVLKNMQSLAKNSQEFGRLLRQLIDRIIVRPFQHCDGGSPVLRAYFELNLASLYPISLAWRVFHPHLGKPWL
jgi:hypothetical protein